MKKININKIQPKYKIIILSLILVLSAFTTLLVINYISNIPSARYYVKVADAIGAPAGFTVDHDRDYVQSWGFGGNADVRRAYVGEGTFNDISTYMLNRLHAIGFNNAYLRNGDGVLTAKGIIATCKNTAVFIRIQQKDDQPIDMEIYPGNSPNGPSCPKL